MDNQKGLINISLECMLACENCIGTSLDLDNVTPLAQCIRLCRDASELCMQLARILARKTAFASDIGMAGLCATVCRACAEECKRHSLPACQACAIACTACADACNLVVQGKVN